jgi:hypothetical protein
MQENESRNINLTEAINKLQQCQDDKNLSSCLNCDDLLDCATRDEYVDLVYKSMAGDDDGGFEF